MYFVISHEYTRIKTQILICVYSYYHPASLRSLRRFCGAGPLARGQSLPATGPRRPLGGTRIAGPGGPRNGQGGADEGVRPTFSLPSFVAKKVLRIEPISNAAHRVNIFRTLRIFLKLLAQPCDVNIYGSGGNIALIFPYVLH